MTCWVFSLSNHKYAFLTMLLFFCGFSNFLGFTKTVSSMWAMTLLSLYVRVQVTILGRHLYLDIARGTNGAQLQVDLCPQAPHSMLKHFHLNNFHLFLAPVIDTCTLDG
jgi:hypothetical protein